MNKNLEIRIILLSALMLSLFFITSQCKHVYSQNEAETLIEEADKSIIDAYLILLEAESSGANIIPVLKILDSAANQINQATIILNEGDEEPNIGELEATIILLNDVMDEAIRLKTSAIKDKEEAQRLSILYSLIKITVFLVVMYFSWSYVKSQQRKRIMEYKPEIVQYV